MHIAKDSKYVKRRKQIVRRERRGVFRIMTGAAMLE
jgi:hypothetical protein